MLKASLIWEVESSFKQNPDSIRNQAAIMDLSKLRIGTMTLYVKEASSNATMKIEPKGSDSIFVAKFFIEREKGDPVDMLIRSYNGTKLQDQKPLSYDNKNSSILHAIFCSPWAETTEDNQNLIVQMPNSKNFVIDGKPWFTIRDTKAMIESFKTLSLGQFILRLSGKTMEDYMIMIISDYNTCDESPIYVLQPAPKDNGHEMGESSRRNNEFRILVRDFENIWEGWFMVTASTTISNIKVMIGRVTMVETELQELYHGESMIKLEDDKSLGFYGIKEKFILWLSSPNMKFFIKMPQVGSTIMLKMFNSITIGEIKHIVFEKLGVPLNCQHFFYSGSLLDDDDLLEIHEIEMSTVLYLIIGRDSETQTLPVVAIKLPNGEVHEIQVKPWFTIAELKLMIQSLFEIPVCIQYLIYNDARLLDRRTVQDYNIGTGCLVHVAINDSPVTIFVNIQSSVQLNRMIWIQARNSYTVERVMNMIPRKHMASINGNPCLFLNDLRLLGSKILAEYGIVSRSVLCLDRLIQVEVIKPDGTATKVEMRSSYRLYNVKKKIEDVCGIPRALQTLKFRGVEVDDYMSLGNFEALVGSRRWVIRWNNGPCPMSSFWPSYEGSTGDQGWGRRPWRAQYVRGYGLI